MSNRMNCSNILREEWARWEQPLGGWHKSDLSTGKNDFASHSDPSNQVNAWQPRLTGNRHHYHKLESTNMMEQRQKTYHQVGEPLGKLKKDITHRPLVINAITNVHTRLEETVFKSFSCTRRLCVQIEPILIPQIILHKFACNLH